RRDHPVRAGTFTMLNSPSRSRDMSGRKGFRAQVAQGNRPKEQTKAPPKRGSSVFGKFRRSYFFSFWFCCAGIPLLCPLVEDPLESWLCWAGAWLEPLWPLVEGLASPAPCLGACPLVEGLLAPWFCCDAGAWLAPLFVPL